MRFELTVDGDGDPRTALEAVAGICVVTQARINGVAVQPHDIPAFMEIAATGKPAFGSARDWDIQAPKASLDTIPFASKAAEATAITLGLTPDNFIDHGPPNGIHGYTKAEVMALVDTLRAES